MVESGESRSQVNPNERRGWVTFTGEDDTAPVGFHTPFGSSERYGINFGVAGDVYAEPRALSGMDRFGFILMISGGPGVGRSVTVYWTARLLAALLFLLVSSAAFADQAPSRVNSIDVTKRSTPAPTALPGHAVIYVDSSGVLNISDGDANGGKFVPMVKATLTPTPTATPTPVPPTATPTP